MAKLELKAGSTSKTVQVFIQDSSVTTGAGLTGLAYNTASLVASYVQPGASRAAITLATLAAANSAWSSGGFKEIDSTNCPGLYRLDIPDACLTGASHVTIHLKGAANMVPCLLEVELVSYDPFDTVRLGLTALPNAAAGANGGLPTVDAANRIVGIQGTKHTFDDLNDLSQANIRTAVGLASANLDTQIGTLATLTKLLKYVQLLARKDAAIATDNATELTAINANGGSGAGAYDNTTDAQEALRDRGDASWTTVTAAAIRTAVGLASNNLDTQIGTLATPAQVNAEVVDALNVDTYAEPGQGTPAATTTLAAKINYLYKNWRNKKTQTSSQWSLLNDDAATVDQKAAVADDGTTASKGEIAAGP